MTRSFISSFFFFNDTATTEIYTLSLHDALPIYWTPRPTVRPQAHGRCRESIGQTSHRICCDQNGSQSKSGSRDGSCLQSLPTDRKSTRLNSSHSQISYAVFCLKKKKKQEQCT